MINEFWNRFNLKVEQLEMFESFEGISVRHLKPANRKTSPQSNYTDYENNFAI